MRRVALPSGERGPAFGQGAWRMGENRATRAEDIETLRLGLDLGATLIDTAKMYGEGLAEELIAEAIAGANGAGKAGRIAPSFAPGSGFAPAADQAPRWRRATLRALFVNSKTSLLESAGKNQNTRKDLE